jgi:hypothetical protein
MVGFSEDEGWWAVGAHLFLMIIFATVSVELAGTITGPLLGDSGLAGKLADMIEIFALIIGGTGGDSIFNAARRRYRRRRQ